MNRLAHDPIKLQAVRKAGTCARANTAHGLYQYIHLWIMGI